MLATAVDTRRHRDEVTRPFDGFPRRTFLGLMIFAVPCRTKNTSSVSSCRCKGLVCPGGMSMVEKVKCTAGTVVLSLVTPQGPVLR